MVFKTLEELIQTLRRNLSYNYGGLSLDNYLLLIAENKETNDVLAAFERNGRLPRTVAWFDDNKYYRLYQRSEEFQWVDPLCCEFGLYLWLLTEPHYATLVPLARFRNYEKVGDPNLMEEEPAVLDKMAVKVLDSLFFLANCLLFPEE